ncbi:hypothetical protein CRENBAI_009891, partial [Crenichthys baileyi]
PMTQIRPTNSAVNKELLPQHPALASQNVIIHSTIFPPECPIRQSESKSKYICSTWRQTIAYDWLGSPAEMDDGSGKDGIPCQKERKGEMRNKSWEKGSMKNVPIESRHRKTPVE